MLKSFPVNYEEIFTILLTKYEQLTFPVSRPFSEFSTGFRSNTNTSKNFYSIFLSEREKNYEYHH